MALALRLGALVPALILGGHLGVGGLGLVRRVLQLGRALEADGFRALHARRGAGRDRHVVECRVGRRRRTRPFVMMRRVAVGTVVSGLLAAARVVLAGARMVHVLGRQR